MKKIISYVVYWLIQCTWGFIMTFIGAIVALGLLITKHKPCFLGPNIYFIVGSNWGGISFGPFFFCCQAADKIKLHEAGHGIQNLIWGPLMPFVIGFPSLVRSWIRKYPTHLKKSLFNLFFLLVALIITTLLACLTGPLLHWHWTTIGLEILRLYFCMVSIWLTLFEIPRYDRCDKVLYDAIWFEGQATRWGEKIYEKKED